MLNLRNVGVCYLSRAGLLRRDRFWALRDVSFDLYRGETLGVIGRNGAGKTTLLKTLAGILKPDRGQMTSDGSQVMLLSMPLGFVPYLSGRDNVVLSGLLLGESRRVMISKMEEIIVFSELGDFIDQPVYSYSAGMKARLGFSIAFHTNPDIILIDEVLGVGDASFRQKSTAAMRARVRSDKTVVLVSHSEVAIRNLCDRVVWIENGESQIEGPTEEVLQCYHSYLTHGAKE